MKRTRESGIFAVALVTAVLWSGCNFAQSEPPPPRPFGEVESVERGVIAAVHDTMIDLRTGQSKTLSSSATVPVGPVWASIPITLGGEKRREVPAEEITVRLSSGRLVLVVQVLSQPPFAVGEQVKVQHEKPHYISGEARTRVVRAED